MDDKLLQLYFEGRTDDEQSRLITEWLSADEANMRHYQRLCRLFELCFWLERPEKEVAFSRRKSSVRRILWNTLKVAAVFILGFALSYALMPRGEAEEDAVMQAVYVSAGQNIRLELGDGSTVWLNAGSRLDFPTRFKNGERKVYLDGEGFFEVKADKERPFIVSTSRYDITALGTSFNVYAYERSPEFETALLTGKVEVFNRSTKHMVSLAPSERAILKNQKLLVASLDNMDYFLWREGVICFDEPLLDVFERLELYFDVNIYVKNKSVLENVKHCTGKFRTRDGLDHILNVLRSTNHFSYERDEERNMITIY